MSSRFHNKWHRSNHHTNPTPVYPDSSHDPIASPEYPFQGQFVIESSGVSLSSNGGIQVPFILTENLTADNILTDSITGDIGEFYNFRITNFLTGNLFYFSQGYISFAEIRSLSALYFEIQQLSAVNATFNNLSATNGVFTAITAVSSNFTTIDITQYELSGFNVTGDVGILGNVAITGCLLTNCVCALPGATGISFNNNVNMQGYSISGIGNNSLAFANGTKLSSPTTNTLNIQNNLTVANSISSPSVSAANFYGNGSLLTGITAEWDGSHVGNANITGNLSVTGKVSSTSNNISGTYVQATYTDESHFLSEPQGSDEWGKFSYQIRSLTRFDNTATQLSGSKPAVAIYNASETPNTTTRLDFVSQYAGDPFAVAGLIAKRETTGGSFIDGSLNLFAMNNDGYPRYMTLNQDGKIGIGTQSPNKELTVVGSVCATNNLAIGSNVTQVTGNILSIKGGNVRVDGVDLSSNFNITSFDTDGQSLFDLRSASPSANYNLSIASSGVGHFMKFFGGRDTDPKPFIVVKTGEPLRFASYSNFFNTAQDFTEYARIDTSTGNVGIGTQNPNQRLTVSGNICGIGNGNITGALTVGGSISSPSISASNLYVGNSSIYFYSGATIYSDTSANIYTSSPIYNAGLTTWRSTSAVANNRWESVAYGDGIFVAVSRVESEELSAVKSMYSTDGIAWLSGNLSNVSTSNWSGVTYGKGLFVAVGDNYTATSVDGINWTGKFTGIASNNAWYDVVYGNDRFVAIAYNGTPNTEFITSTDGMNWSVVSGLPSKAWFRITYGNGIFVAGSLVADTEYSTSTDGLNWTTRTSPANLAEFSIDYANGLFILGTGTGTIYTSTNAIDWTLRYVDPNNDSQWTSFTYGNGVYVGVGLNGGRIIASIDGANWRLITTTFVSLINITYGDGIFVATSQTGSNRQRVYYSGKKLNINEAQSKNLAFGPQIIAGTLSVTNSISSPSISGNNFTLSHSTSSLTFTNTISSIASTLTAAEVVFVTLNNQPRAIQLFRY